MIDKRLRTYLDDFEKDRLQRNHIRDWSYRGLHLRLFPNVFPSDSPYSLTTISMLDALERDSDEFSRTDFGTAVDIGAGNGSFALYLARLVPRAQIIAVDNHPAALAAVRWNARHAGVANVNVVGSDLFGAFDSRLRARLAVVALPFVQELRREGLTERFWAEARHHLCVGARVYFSWAEWVSFSRLEKVAAREGFAVIQSNDYSLERLSYRWRIYVFEARGTEGSFTA